MHALHNMFDFEGKVNIHAAFLMYLFMGICIPQCSFSYLADFLAVVVFFLRKALAIITKCSVIDVAGVLNPL